MNDGEPKYLTHTENFSKSRRNYTISAVTIIVLALSDPKSIKIPGIGDNAALQSPIAFICLWIAMFYFAWVYKDEHQYTLIINSTAAETSLAQDDLLLSQLRDRIEQISLAAKDVATIKNVSMLRFDEDWSSKLDTETMNGIQNSIHFAANMISRTQPNLGSVDSPESVVTALSKSLDHWVSHQMQVLTEYYESYRTRLNHRIHAIESEFIPRIPEILSEIGEMQKSLEHLGKSYQKISKEIYRSQQISFHLRDTWLAIGLGLLATVLAVSKIAGITALQCSWAPNIANSGALHSP